MILIDPSLDERWDAFVDRHPWGWVTHLSGWKRALERAFPQMKGHYLALVDKYDQIKAGLPLFEVRSALTGNRLVSVPFATLCDPLVDTGADLGYLLSVAIEMARELEVKNLEVRSFRSTSILSSYGLQAGFRYVNHYLTLNGSQDFLMSSFHKTAVQQVIRKAQRFNPEIVTHQTNQDLEDFYPLYVATRKKLGLPPQPYIFFWCVCRELGWDKVTFSTSYIGGKPLASAMFFTYKKRVSCEAVGVEPSVRNSGMVHLLFWKAIRQAMDEGKEVFDFGRTSKENIGLMTFKARWGTKIEELGQFRIYDKRGPSFRKLSPNYIEKARRVCSKLPVPLFEALGRLCYRHMS
ncbi:MAG: GNAT family N-acetyltransferase [Candidatus Hadarchaeum sp.]